MKDRPQWVRYIFTEQRRFLQGASDNLLVELEQFDREKYINYLRMTPELFYEVFNVVSPLIEKKHEIRTPISSKTRLQIFLRFLASGNSMTSLSFEFRVGVSTISNIIRTTAEAVYDALSPKVLLINPTQEDWLKVAKGFEQKWNMYNCCGAIDGRHMVMQVCNL